MNDSAEDETLLGCSVEIVNMDDTPKDGEILMGKYARISVPVVVERDADGVWVIRT